MTIFIIVIVVILIILNYVIKKYNDLVKGRNKVEEAFSTMDVYLKKRFDLIPNLVSTVKGYTKYESTTLEKIVKERAQSYNTMNIDDKVKLNNELSSAIGKILAVAEQYPDLKANQNFLDLSSQLSSIEDEIANSRKYYNATVRAYNNKVQMFPGNIVAKIFKFNKCTMFEVSNENERENVKVEF